MKKLLLLLAVVFLSGCLTRTYVTEQPRIDLDIEGNQGYISGNPPEIQRQYRLGKTRKVAVWEIELGGHGPRKKAEVEEPAIDEYIEEDSSYDDYEDEDVSISTSENEITEYTVQKNDTLQKISDKFYGTTKKWMFLYESNKHVLASPNKVYPGIVLEIPELE
ncbi:MAG: LysM peptidoglycan-binding domain-containing protein [Candidatus Omnitrophica bacterium]|nr:LysM peptidoglycan-binding domain-containing protein [Candidatus Omnitrophota bacterium]